MTQGMRSEVMPDATGHPQEVCVHDLIDQTTDHSWTSSDQNCFRMSHGCSIRLGFGESGNKVNRHLELFVKIFEPHLSRKCGRTHCPAVRVTASGDNFH